MDGLDDFYKKILDNMQDGVYFVDRHRLITYWNKGAERITGYKSEHVFGSCCADNILMHVDEVGTSLCDSACPVHQCMMDGREHEGNVYLHHADGHRVPVSVRVSPISNDEGEIIGAVEVFSDNSPMVSALSRVEQLQNQIAIDPLTNVGSRRYTEMQLHSAISEFQRFQMPFGLLFLDIDRFKGINDTFGHHVGDQVLRMVAGTLRHNIRAFDYIGRWGGEEFIALITNVDKSQLRFIAEKLRRLVGHSRLQIEENQISVSISIGATIVAPTDTEESIVHRADLLMYQSKKDGRNRLTMG
jgi:diguanylate cyclase (GGDEF)-like protein/PAS domain S-box-containing protein